MDRIEVNALVHIAAIKGGVQFLLPIEDLDQETLTALRTLLRTGDVASLEARHSETLEGRRVELVLDEQGIDPVFVNFKLHCLHIDSPNDVNLLEILARNGG